MSRELKWRDLDNKRICDIIGRASHKSTSLFFFGFKFRSQLRPFLIPLSSNFFSESESQAGYAHTVEQRVSAVGVLVVLPVLPVEERGGGPRIEGRSLGPMLRALP
jgi:hypothetical protein